MKAWLALFWEQLCCSHDWSGPQQLTYRLDDPANDLGVIGYTQVCPKCRKKRYWWKPYP